MIKVYNNIVNSHAAPRVPLTVKEVFFGGGEKHIKIESFVAQNVDIFLNYENDSNLVELFMYVDALKRMGAKVLNLNIPYFPGARQDRVCNEGEALSVKVYADMINSMGFEKVRIFDPHSEVTPALINNVVVHNNHTLVNLALNDILRIAKKDDIVLISPDAGSNKKIYDLATKKLEGKFPVVRCDKIRDVSNGKIVDTEIYADTLMGKTCVIIDDIISYGNTFFNLSRKLKEKGANRVYLIVSHCEGVANLKTAEDSGISAMFTTNSKPWNINNYNTNNYITGFDINTVM